MISVKKYIHFLFVIGLCLSITNNKASEFLYDISIPTEELAEVSNVFGGMVKEIFRENPRLLAVPAFLIVTGSLFMGRGKIAGLAKQKYEELETGAKTQATMLGKTVEETVPLKTRVSMGVLRPFFGGFPEYFKYNKWYMSVAGILASIGCFLGHSFMGGGVGGAVLIKGWFDQGFTKVDKRFDKVDQALVDLDEKNTKLHKETQATVDAIDKSVKDLSKQLDTTGAAIQTQMSGLEIKVSGDIKKVGQDLTELDKKLKDVPQHILKMTDDLKAAQEKLKDIKGSSVTIMQQNNAIVKQTKVLSQQLTDATQQFVSTKEKFDKLGETLTTQVKKLAEDTQKQINIMQDYSEKQTEEMQQLRSDADKEFKELFKRVTANNLLLQSFKNIQESQDQQLTQLLDKINCSEACGQETLDLVNGLIDAQKQSAGRYHALAASLDKAQEISTKSTNVIIDKIQKIETVLEGLEAKINVTEEKVDALAVKLEDHEHKRKVDCEGLVTEIRGNRKVTDSLQQDFNCFKVDQQRQNEGLEWLHSAFAKLQRESEQKQLELYRVINNLNLRLEEAYQTLHKKIDQNLELTKETNSIARSSFDRIESLPTPYPLRVPISGSYPQERQISNTDSNLFPSGKTILPKPKQYRPLSPGTRDLLRGTTQ